jgi:multicomponent Na+:H+ antiporter subunit B
MVVLFGVFLLTLLVLTAVAIVRTDNLFVAVMLTGIFSLLMAANFFILDAADVALTEAAIGAGITTVLFLGALALTAEHEKSVSKGRWLSMGVVIVTTLILIYATFEKPRLGDPQAPVHQHVAPWYLEQTPELIDIPNVVTAVLGSFRGYDTLGELNVILTACIGVLFILGGRRGQQLPSEGKALPSTAHGLRHHLIPKVVGLLVIPFIVLFGFYIQFHGEYGPGGGFQAGAIVAAGIILYALLEGEAKALKAVPRPVLMGMVIGGAMLYGAVGIAGIALGGNFLDYSVLADNPVTGQQLGILIIELGVGSTVCGALLLIFHAFATYETD